MLVTVHSPRLQGARVRFTWDQDIVNQRQHRDHWFIRYPGLPLANASPVLLLEIMLSLQLPVWASQAQDVVVHLPQPFPRVVAQFWLAYHEISNVTIRPLIDVKRYEPWRGRNVGVSKRVAVTFGGGKDSTLAYEALRERYGRDQVLLFHAVHPFSARFGATRRAVRRSRRLILKPMKIRDAQVQLMITDFIANLTPGKIGRPSVNLYLAGGLPILLHHGVRAITVSHTASSYVVRKRSDGTRRWGNSKNRPEALAMLGDYYRRVLGFEVQAVATHFPISEYVSFKTLLRNYRYALEGIVMCMRADSPRVRWCHDCKKCFEYAVFGLSLGHVDPNFDYNELFGNSAYVGALIEYTTSEARKAARGPLPWAPLVGTRTHFAAFCHAMSKVKPSLLGNRLEIGAGRNLEVLRTAFGQRSFPAVDAILAGAVNATGLVGRVVADVAARHSEVVDVLPGVLLDGNEVSSFAFGEVMPTLDLDALVAGFIRSDDATTAE